MYHQIILVPLDGSKMAECVLPHVEALVLGSQEKRVIFVRVVEPFRCAMGMAHTYSDEEVHEITSKVRAEAEAYLDKVRIGYQGAKAESVVLYGSDVAATLAEYATQNKIDLIVMASHGSSGVSRRVWGSVADRILRSACIPVYMVRSPDCARRESEVVRPGIYPECPFLRLRAPREDDFKNFPGGVLRFPGTPIN